MISFGVQVQLPSMPDLPSVGASALAGMGFGAGAGGVGSGTGYGAGLGSGSGLGSGFMSMSFLGTTSQRTSKIVFVVDVGTGLLDIRKGGFEAFAIIREEADEACQPPAPQRRLWGRCLPMSRIGGSARPNAE